MFLIKGVQRLIKQKKKSDIYLLHKFPPLGQYFSST